MPEQACVYCGAEATETDHLISNNQARQSMPARRCRDLARFKVPACHDCNFLKYTYHRVPFGYEDLIPELEAITGNEYSIWTGA